MKTFYTIAEKHNKMHALLNFKGHLLVSFGDMSKFVIE